MHFDEQVSKYMAMDRWFKTPQGYRVAQAFTAELTPIADQMKGQRLLQLGHCGDNLWLSLLKFHVKWIVNPCPMPKKTQMISSLTALPIERDSIDCLIAPLTLEAFERPKSPIDEMDRVLKPLGYAIFFGINPISFWGAALRFNYLQCFGPISSVRLMSSMTLKHEMLHRGYRQCFFDSFYYIPPVSSEYLIEKSEFLNEMGKMIWPYPAGFYCLVMQKHQYVSPFIPCKQTNEALVLGKKTALQAMNQSFDDQSPNV